MLMYLMLMILTLVTAFMAVWLYRKLSIWKSSATTMVLPSRGSFHHSAARQYGYLQAERKVRSSRKNTGAKNAKGKTLPSAKKKFLNSSAKGGIRKPWGW